jgi:hypothetical protein
MSGYCRGEYVADVRSCYDASVVLALERTNNYILRYDKAHSLAYLPRTRIRGESQGITDTKTTRSRHAAVFRDNKFEI